MNGLPLMGTGDWNDGMNRVGREGRGESVWLGFFIHFVLGEFISLCESRADHARVEGCHAYRERLRDALSSADWEGGWHRRAYYNDGTPLASARGDECRIDAVARYLLHFGLERRETPPGPQQRIPSCQGEAGSTALPPFSQGSRV